MERIRKSTGAALAFAGAAMMGLGAGGCAVEEEADAPEPGTGETTASVLRPTFTEAAMSPHGGSGGTYTGHVTPPSIIYGVQVRSGALVDSISFAWYQPSRGDNLRVSTDYAGVTP